MSEDPSRGQRAAAILREIAADAPLVPAELREWWSSYLDYHSGRYLTMLSYLDPAPSELLELGSAPGHFTALVQALGYRVRGVDVDPDRLRAFWQKRAIEMWRADVETDRLPFLDGSFDLVLFTEILEHLRINPLFTFRELARVLRPGGRLIISTPNITPSHRLLFVLGKNCVGNLAQEYKKLETLGHMGHARLWFRRDVQDFLDEVGGLRIESMHYEGEYVAGGWKTTLMRALYPIKRHFRMYTYYVIRRTSS